MRREADHVGGQPLGIYKGKQALLQHTKRARKIELFQEECPFQITI